MTVRDADTSAACRSTDCRLVASFPTAAEYQPVALTPIVGGVSPAGDGVDEGGVLEYQLDIKWRTVRGTSSMNDDVDYFVTIECHNNPDKSICAESRNVTKAVTLVWVAESGNDRDDERSGLETDCDTGESGGRNRSTLQNHTNGGDFSKFPVVSATVTDAGFHLTIVFIVQAPRTSCHSYNLH